MSLLLLFGSKPSPPIVARGIQRPIRAVTDDPRLARREKRQQLRQITRTSNGQTVAVPFSRVTMVAVAPSRTAGQATVTAPPTQIRLLSVAPSVTATVAVSVPPSQIRLAGVAPSVQPAVSVAVPFSRVTDRAVAPLATAGTRTLTPQIAAVRLLAVAPEVRNFILVPAAPLRLLALAPSVTGGGGGGGTVTLRKSGD